MTRRGGDNRGSSRDRWRRKQWMLANFGDGVECPCAMCGRTLNHRTVEADRIEPGGSYRHENVQPACRKCNARKSNRAA